MFNLLLKRSVAVLTVYDVVVAVGVSFVVDVTSPDDDEVVVDVGDTTSSVSDERHSSSSPSSLKFPWLQITRDFGLGLCRGCGRLRRWLRAVHDDVVGLAGKFFKEEMLS